MVGVGHRVGGLVAAGAAGALALGLLSYPAGWAVTEVADPGAATAAARPLPPVPLSPTADGPATVEVVADGLDIPWDIGFLPDGSALVNERAGGFKLIADPTRPGSPVTSLEADFSDVVAVGVGGVSGMAIRPDFAQSRRFITCLSHQEGGNPVDVRLVTWELSADGGNVATRDEEPVYTGQPIEPGGLHSDCRPRFGPDGALWVVTGDAATASVSQDLRSLGGKTLRIDPETGGPAAGNPFSDSPDPVQRLVHTYGHRNPQGIAFQPGTGHVYNAEHGPDIDDEVNLLVPGGNYGWDPSRGGTVQGFTGPKPQNVPMTDMARFPGAVPAAWSSGTSTVAPADAEFLTDPRWGPRTGMLAVATLKGSQLLLMRIAPDGSVSEVSTLPELDNTHGRLRAVETGPDGALYITTSNGSDDKVLRVAPF